MAAQSRQTIGAQRNKRAVLLILTAFLVGWLAACGDEPQLPELAPDEILLRSAETMRSLEGFHFAIDRDGALAYIDSGETIAFGSGFGDFVAPDRARAEVKIIAPGFVTTVAVVSVGPIQWETNMLSGEWTELPPDWGFNPTVIFDADIGLQSILETDATNLMLAEPEQVDTGPDKLLYKINGDLSAERLYQMSGFLIGPDDVTFTTWVDPETFELVRVMVNDPPTNPEDDPTTWQIDFSEFGRIVEIEPPSTSSP